MFGVLQVRNTTVNGSYSPTIGWNIIDISWNSTSINANTEM